MKTHTAPKAPRRDDTAVRTTDENATSLIKQFDAALVRRRTKTRFISDERREQLRNSYWDVMANPDAETTIECIRRIRDDESYLAVAGSFEEFCTSFLGREQTEVEQLLLTADDPASYAEDAPAEPADVMPGDLSAPPERPADQASLQVVATSMAAGQVTLPAVQQQGAPGQASAPVVVAEMITESMPTFWASRINGHIADGVASLVHAGRDLIEAKSKLPHGSFQSLFEPGLLRISQRTAQKLMMVAGNPALGNANNCSFLPPTLNSLVVLAKVDEAGLQRAIDDRRISPGLTIAETRTLVTGLLKGKARRKRKAAIVAKQSESDAPEVNYTSPDHAAAFSRITMVLDEEFQRCPTQAWGKKLLNRVTAYLQGVRENN